MKNNYWGKSDMMCSDGKQFAESAVFRRVYLFASLIFALLFAYRAALIITAKPGYVAVLIFFVILAALFLRLWVLAGRKDAKMKMNFQMLTAGFMCVYGLSLSMAAQRSLVWLLLFALALFFLRYALKKESTAAVRGVSLGLGGLFALFVFLGAQLETYGRLEILYGLGEPLAALRILACFAGQFLLYTIVLNTMLAEILERDFSRAEDEKSGTVKGVFTVAIAAVGILLCWLPYYYAFYPGNLSPDSFYELRMQLGIEPLSNHHPYVHQLLIALALRLGGTLEQGVGIYSAMQMLLLALAFALCVYFLGKMGVKRYIQAVAFCFFALFPVNAFYSVTMWKDVPYGAISLLFMMLLILNTKGEEKRKSAFWGLLLLVLTAFLFCVFRNNGWYAFLLGFPLFIICNRKNWKRLCAVFLIVVLLVSGYNHIIFNVMGIKKSASGEALSVPLQQIARTVSKNPEQLQNEDFQVLREVLPELEKLGEIYHPNISDPVKAEGTFLSSVFSENPIRYLKSWVKIGLKHPVTYVEAFLLQCYGYWYPDVTYWIVHNDIEANELGLEQKEERTALRFELSMFTRDVSQNLPTAILFSLGLMVWLMMIAAVLLCLKGQGKIASSLFILAGLWLTTLASPVYCEYRYMYGFVVCVPLFLGLALGMKKTQGREE